MYKSIHLFYVRKLKNITFKNSKYYFIYYNILFCNTLSIKYYILTFNTLKSYKQRNKIIYQI